MANNVTQISGATPIEFYLGNYAYADIVTDMEILQFRLDTAGSERIFYKNAAGTVFKIMTDASDDTNHSEGSIFFADSVGACDSSENLLFFNDTIKLSNLTASRVVVINEDKELASSDITVTELNALDEISGNIQDQINALGQISGIENYLVKYTIDNIGESIIYDDGGNVGIGTTTPSSRLHVEDDSVIPPTVALRNAQIIAEGANQQIQIGVPGTVNTRYAWILANRTGAGGGNYYCTLHLQPVIDGTILDYEGVAIGFAPTLKLNSTVGLAVNGNVGIGTDAPTQLLHIAGAGAPRIRITDDLSSEALIGVSDNNGAFITLSDDEGNSNVFIRSYGVSYFAGGNVGIGTTTPLGQLDVSYGGITLVLGADTGATTRTNTVIKKFNIEIPHYLSASANVALFNGLSQNGGNVLNIGDASGSLNTWNYIRFYLTSNYSVPGGEKEVLEIDYGKVTIDASLDVTGNAIISSNCWIGEVISSAKLNVVGTPIAVHEERIIGLFNDDTSYGTGVGGGIGFGGKCNSGGDYATFAAIKGVKVNGGDNEQGDLYIQANSGTGLYNVAKFGHGGILQLYNLTDNYLVKSGSTGLISSIVYDNGTKVGIGTTSPAGRLDVSYGGHDLIIGADLGATSRTNSTNKYGITGCVHYTNAEEPFTLIGGASSTGGNVVIIGGGWSDLNGATSIEMYTSPDTTTLNGVKRMVIDSDGKVGIGSGSPLTDVEIRPATDETVKLTITGDKSISTVGDEYCSVDFRSGGDPSPLSTNDIVGRIVSVAEYGNGAYAGMAFYTVDNSSSPYIKERVRIDHNGYVGIGTNDPGTKLAVTGLPEYTGNNAAIAAGLSDGDFYKIWVESNFYVVAVVGPAI